jgi:hypothetical protein
MKSRRPEMEFAIEVFVRAHSAGRSRTFPCEASRVGSLWVMRDAPRRNPRDYRKEEWIAHGVGADEVDATARRQTRGRFFVCAITAEGEPDEPTRSDYRLLGYRLRGSGKRLDLGQSRTTCSGTTLRSVNTWRLMMRKS